MASREAMIKFLGPTLPWAGNDLVRCTTVRPADRGMAPGRRCELRPHGAECDHALLYDTVLIQWRDPRPSWWRRLLGSAR